MEEGRQVSKQITFDPAIVGPAEEVPQAMEEAVAVGRHAEDAEPLARKMIADVVQVACVHGWARIGSLADSTIVGPQEGPIVCQKPRSCITARRTSTCGD